MSEETISICSVGDLMICDSPLYASVGVGSKYQEIRTRFIDSCKKQVNKADVVIGNFEAVVYTPKNSSLDETQMACNQSVVKDLSTIGFTILNIANNHSLQHGTEGFNNTIAACVKNGIDVIGIKDQEPTVLEIKGKRIALLSLCIHIEWYQPDDVLYESNIERVLKKIRKLRLDDEELLIVVSVHWGDEYAEYPSNAQVLLGHEFIDSGANIILGHHPHVFQGIENYHGGIIAYSQGNYVSDMVPQICRQTGILSLKIDSHKRITYEIIPQLICDEFCHEVINYGWFLERQKELEAVLSGKRSDDDYWSAVSKNHAQGHNDFLAFFKKNIFRYKINVSLKMVIEFIGRKIQRVIGTSSDGRVSSMDAAISEAIKNSHSMKSNDWERKK